MAIYSFRVSIVKRSTGRSAVAAAAYRAAEELGDDRTGLTHDYSRKGGVLHSEILAPDGAPDWVLDRERLWNAAEASETRVNSQVAREFTVALPHELNDEQRIELVREFLKQECVSKGMVADFAVHLPERTGDQRNHHAHAMLSMRELEPEGFGRKAREWNARGQLETWRSAWAAHVNQALERADRPERIDHRTLDAQGDDREATTHEGPVVTALSREGEPLDAAQVNAEKRRRNADRGQLEGERREVDTQIERPELASAQKAGSAKPDLNEALRHLRQVDKRHGELNAIRRDIAEARKTLYAHDKRAGALKRLDEAVTGGFETLYRDPQKAKEAFLEACHAKNSNPAKAARLMKNRPAEYGRMKGWAIGNLWHSRTRKEALTVLPQLADKARKAEYSRRKLERSADAAEKAQERLEDLSERKQEIEKHDRPERLVAQRQLQQAARGMERPKWDSLTDKDRFAIADARREMKSRETREYADRLIAEEKRRARERELELERQRRRDQGLER
ncbi:MobQ family relaxase [Marinicauda sp. Alg238-R41]|uniref:MobQ family relaxase n=1 Tax=Marinicauda sp. Alg238-R41 TaxID=2993447 RepID=UPI002FD80B46